MASDDNQLLLIRIAVKPLAQHRFRSNTSRTSDAA